MACLGIRLGKLKSYSCERLALGQAGVVNRRSRARCRRTVDFFADQGGQHVEHGTPLAGRLVEHLLIQFGDAVELQLRQVARAASRGVVRSCLGFLVVGVAAEPVVAGRVGLFQVDVFDQFAAFGLQGRGRGKLAAAALLQEEGLHVGRVVGLVLEGLADGGQHLLAAVEPHQAQQPPQMDASA